MYMNTEYYKAHQQVILLLYRKMGYQYSHIYTIDNIKYELQYSIKHERCYKLHSLKVSLTNVLREPNTSSLTMSY
jgi:hypothetical protein